MYVRAYKQVNIIANSKMAPRHTEVLPHGEGWGREGRLVRVQVEVERG